MTLDLFGRYEREARLAPGLLLLAPLATAAAALSPEARDVHGAVALAGLLMVGGLFLSDMVRARGKAAERELFRRWGGAPTTRMLRWANAEDAGDVERRHQAVEGATGLVLPDQGAERSDPRQADVEYGEAVAILRSKTRDRKRFAVIFAENVVYGRKRNTWAIRQAGRATAAVSIVAGGLAFSIPEIREHSGVGWPAFAILLGLVFMFFWIHEITEQAVLGAAELYARALFEGASAFGPRRVR